MERYVAAGYEIMQYQKKLVDAKKRRTYIETRLYDMTMSRTQSIEIPFPRKQISVKTLVKDIPFLDISVKRKHCCQKPHFIDRTAPYKFYS